MTDALDFRHVGECGLYHRFKTGDGAPGTIVDILFEPEVRHGSSDRGEGTIHHVAFAVDSVEQQAAIKERLMAMGHVDTSDSSTHCVDLGSTCFKMPGGVMFKALASP
jgi:glyoxalase family protein